MRADFKGNRLRIVPEGDEVKQMNIMFPDAYLKTSKVIKVKSFVDGFGAPTGNKYLEIKGFTEKEMALEEAAIDDADDTADCQAEEMQEHMDTAPA